MLNKLYVAVASCVAPVVFMGFSASAFAKHASGDWNQYQHDTSLSDRSKASGPAWPTPALGWPVSSDDGCRLGPPVADVRIPGTPKRESMQCR